jgi:hypothetical protein
MRRGVGGRAAIGVALGVVVLLAGLAGCSAAGGSAGATTTTDGQQDAAAVWRELVACARANGMPNLPDPQIDSNGRADFPNGTPDPPASVRRACQSIYDRLPPSARDEQVRPPADIQALLGYARCMREHGIADFPDPQADGRFPLPASLRAGKTPSFLRANQACRQLNPDSKGRLEFNG